MCGLSGRTRNGRRVRGKSFRWDFAVKILTLIRYSEIMISGFGSCPESGILHSIFEHFLAEKKLFLGNCEYSENQRLAFLDRIRLIVYDEPCCHEKGFFVYQAGKVSVSSGGSVTCAEMQSEQTFPFPQKRLDNSCVFFKCLLPTGIAESAGDALK